MAARSANLQEPVVVSSADDVAWDDEADVLIVGYGGAGACAALEARENGADVIAIDRFGGGGATAYSGGIIYAGATRIQEAAGVSDSADEMYKYLRLEAGDVVKPETLQSYCDRSADLIDWLIGHGVPYSPELFTEKTLYPPEGKFLYYAGNEKVPEFAAAAKPAPRGHRPVGSGMTGNVYFSALAEAARQAGVRLRPHEKAMRLITDPSGQVIGVESRRLAETKRDKHQSLYNKVVPMIPFKGRTTERASTEAELLEARSSAPARIRARRGVVIASGGFVMNLEMLGRHQPFLARHARAVMRIGSLGCDGSGIELACAAGADTARMDSVFLARNIAPPNALLDGIMVNTHGKRFINEESYSGYLGLAIKQQPESIAWLILPGRSFRTAIHQAVSSGMMFFKYYGVPALSNFLFGGTRRAGSIRKLSRKCGIDPDGLQQTVDRYNEAIERADADPFGKSSLVRKPLIKDSFFAVNMSTSNVFCFTYLFTLGGLKVDEQDGAVLRADGSRIAGLYAAGRAAVGICSNGYISGLSIGDGAFSGRRAGRAAATQ